MVDHEVRGVALVRRRRTVTAAIAASCIATMVVIGAVASPANAIEPAPTQPVLPDSANIATDQYGNWSIVGAAPGNVLTQARPDADPVQAATDAVADYAEGLGVANPSASLTPRPARELADGGSVVRFDQNVSGVPVFAAGVAVRLDADNAAMSVASTIVADDRTAGVDLAPTIDQAGAIELARASIAPNHDPDRGSLTASTPEMKVYDASLIGGDPNAEVLNGPRLVWSLTLASADNSIRYRYLVDAVEPAVLLTFSENEESRDRRVCDFGNTDQQQRCRKEGAAPVAGRDELNQGFDMLGETYDYFNNNFGRDSYDDKGERMEMQTRVCWGGCPFNNAYWDGSTLVFGEGFGIADDIIAHEFTHAVTEYEANLEYYAESGAINESMSDVFGEFVDQDYDLLGNDTAANTWMLGEQVGAIRNMADPTQFGHPDRVLSPNFHTSEFDGYGVHINSGISNKAAYLMAAGGNFNGSNMVAIGNAKTAAIYYEALTSILTPGSDFLNLYGGLQQACANLTGTGGITAGDCETVKRAVTATEMNKPSKLRLSASSKCAKGTRTSVFADDAESGLSAWSTNSGLGKWGITTRASRSGTHSFNGAVADGSATPERGYSTHLQTRSKITVPWTGTSYLWFEHKFNFDWASYSLPPVSFNGGVVEYSLDGTTWKDLGTAADANGYNGAVTESSKSPLAGREAFVSSNIGFQQTRISLAKLRGRAAYIRFRIGATTDSWADGWTIDDVEVYNCSSATTNFGSGYQTVTPQRVIDTRSSVGLVNARGMRPAGSVLKFNAGKLGIYKGGDKPRALNLTITSVGNTAPGHVTAYPCGKRPKTSTLNATEPNSIVVNTATIPVWASGEICIYTHARTHLLVDVAGYQTSTTGSPPPSRYKALGPRRVVDTRNGNGLIKIKGRRRAGSTLTLDVASLGIFKPDTTPRALDLTFTAVNGSGAGHLTAYPCGKRPNTSVLNTYKPGQVVTNTATVAVSEASTVCVYNAATTDVIVDITGYYSDTQGPQLAKYRPLNPKRVVDTRNSTGLYKLVGRRPAGSTLRINLNSLGIAKSGHKPTAYDLTFTMILNGAPGHITAYPCGKRPTASTLNATKSNMVVANTATIPVSANGDVCIYTHAATHLTVDVTGYHYT